MYPTPVHLEDFEEKWIAGVLSGRQAKYAAVGLLLVMAIWFFASAVTIYVRWIFEIPVVWIFLKLASNKPVPRVEMRFDRYLLLRYSYKKKQKKYFYSLP